MWKCDKCGKEFEKGRSYSVHRTHCLSNREPWNKGKKGSQVAWNKGITGEKSHMFGDSRNKGRVYGSYPKERCENVSRGIAKAWKEGKFTPRKPGEYTHSASTRKKISARTKEAMAKMPEKLQELALLRWANPEYKQRMVTNWAKKIGMKPNKLEKRAEAFLKSIDSRCRYVGDGKMWISGRNPDFVIDGTNKLIEVFGTYWHEPEDEEFRKSHFENCGFNTLVIWDREFQDPIYLREKVKAFAGIRS